MKAMVYRRYGDPDALSLTELPMPTPQPGEVRIRVMSSSINSWDLDLLRGKPFIARMGGLIKPKYPVLGADVAGVVDALGHSVTDFKVGDRVFGDVSPAHWGGFGEYLCAPCNLLASIPHTMTWEQAAASPQAGVLAMQSLRLHPQLSSNSRVLLIGAGGGVGTFALQMAKHAGAHITVVDREEKLPGLEALGANEGIDYRQANWWETGQRYDLIVDMVLKQKMSTYLQALNPHGHLAIVGGPIGQIFKIFMRGKSLSKRYQKHLRLVMHTPNRTDLEKLGEQFEAGTVKPVIDQVYPLSKLPQAMQRIADGTVQGKLVINIGKP